MPIYEPFEPVRYQQWRTCLSTDIAKALSTAHANDIDNDCLTFYSSTELRVMYPLGSSGGMDGRTGERTPPTPRTTPEIAFGWDRTEGVCILELNESNREALIPLLGRSMHWIEALEACGGKYYKNWRESPWARAAVAIRVRYQGMSHPYFEDKDQLEQEMLAEANKPEGDGTTSATIERTSKLA